MNDTSSRLAAVPVELRSRPQWVAWAAKLRGSKLTKVPYRVGGDRASPTDPRTWSTFADAVRALRSGRFDGIGFVFTAEDPYVGIDLDHAVQSEIQPWAMQIVRQLDSYTEFSPSATGLHIFCRGRLPARGRRRDNVEMYQDGRFFTVTGAHLTGTPLTIEHRHGAIAAVHAQHVARSETPPIVATPNRAAVNLDDAELLRGMFSSWKGAKVAVLWHGDTSGYPSPSEADLALCRQLAFWTDRDPGRIDRLFRQSGLMRRKWDEREDYRATTIDRAIRSTPNGYTRRG